VDVFSPAAITGPPGRAHAVPLSLSANRYLSRHHRAIMNESADSGTSAGTPTGHDDPAPRLANQPTVTPAAATNTGPTAGNRLRTPHAPDADPPEVVQRNLGKSASSPGATTPRSLIRPRDDHLRQDGIHPTVRIRRHAHPSPPS
jgi:hypothetical protein